jgi:hypothetical protein
MQVELACMSLINPYVHVPKLAKALPCIAFMIGAVVDNFLVI